MWLVVCVTVLAGGMAEYFHVLAAGVDGVILTGGILRAGEVTLSPGDVGGEPFSWPAPCRGSRVGLEGLLGFCGCALMYSTAFSRTRFFILRSALRMAVCSGSVILLRPEVLIILIKD